MILYRFIKYLYLHIKYTRLLNSVYKDEDLLNKFSQLFGVEFRIDWIGRIYTILNPNILDDKLDITTQFFEYTNNGLSNKLYLEKWIMTKFNVIKDFLIVNNLFDLLTYEIKKIDDYDNYLFIIKPITFEDCKIWSKRFIVVYGALLIIAITLFVVL